MQVKPNARYEVFLTEFKRIKRPFEKWRGIAFRATPLPYAAAAKLLNGLGSFKFGGRWSAAGAFPAVNASLAPETAVNESGASFTYYNFSLSDVRPKVLVAVRLNLAMVLNLTVEGTICSRPWLKLDELLAEDWRKINDRGYESESQALGRAAHEAGAEAILIPSARVRGDINLVYFPKSLSKLSKVEILGEEELDHWLNEK